MESRELIRAAGAGPVLGELFRLRAMEQGERIAVQDESRWWSYAQLDERVNRLANVLLNSDVHAATTSRSCRKPAENLSRSNWPRTHRGDSRLPELAPVGYH